MDENSQPDRGVATAVETRDLVLVDDAQLLDAREFVQACERCADTAYLAFDYLLEAVMDGDPTTDYLMLKAATCPSCGTPIYEKTLVVPSEPEA